MMNLRQATRSVLALMTVFSLALISVFFWTVSVLTEPYDVLQHFRVVRDQILVTAAAKLDDYYHTSNSLSLKQAQDTVNDAVSALPQLPEYVQLQLKGPLLVLQRSLNEEISTGGEMAANPDALLEQNERELAGWLRNLEQYADAAPVNRTADAARYRQLALNMRESLQRLTTARETAFRGDRLQENVFVSDLRSLEINLAQLRNLPLLGVMEELDEQDDELTLGIERKQKHIARDKGLTYQEELSGLIARYPREWGFALRDMRTAQRAQLALKAELNAVNDALETADRTLNEWRLHDAEKAQQIFFGLMLAILLLLTFVAWNMKRRVIAPLLRTTKAIREIDDAHGWQLNVPEHSVTELHELAENVNEFITQVRNEKAMNRRVA